MQINPLNNTKSIDTKVLFLFTLQGVVEMSKHGTWLICYVGRRGERE